MSLCFGLLVGQNKTFEDITLDIFHYFLKFYGPNDLLNKKRTGTQIVSCSPTNSIKFDITENQHILTSEKPKPVNFGQIYLKQLIDYTNSD